MLWSASGVSYSGNAMFFQQARACPADQALYTRRNIWRAQWNRDVLPQEEVQALPDSVKSSWVHNGSTVQLHFAHRQDPFCIWYLI